MRTTIDAGGRIVVPKPFRDELGLKPGSEVEISMVGGRIELEVAPNPIRLERRDGRLVAVPERPLPPLTADQVRDALEQIRR